MFHQHSPVTSITSEEQVGASKEEKEETLQLSGVKSIINEFCILDGFRSPANYIGDTTAQLARALSLQPLDGTDVLVNQVGHTLKLFGKMVTGAKIGASIRMANSAKFSVTMKITVHAEEERVAALVIGSVP